MVTAQTACVSVKKVCTPEHSVTLNGVLCSAPTTVPVTLRPTVFANARADGLALAVSVPTAPTTVTGMASVALMVCASVTMDGQVWVVRHSSALMTARKGASASMAPAFVQRGSRAKTAHHVLAPTTAANTDGATTELADAFRDSAEWTVPRLTAPMLAHTMDSVKRVNANATPAIRVLTVPNVAVPTTAPTTVYAKTSLAIATQATRASIVGF